MANFVNLIVLVICFLTAVHRFDCCSCSQRHPQDEFCRSHFVLLAVVDSVALLKNDGQEDYGNVKHRLRDIQVLKTSGQYEQVREKDYIHTPDSDGMCRSDLVNQTKYIIFGTVAEDGSLYTVSCSRTQPWDMVSEEYKTAYLDDPSKYCSQCQIAHYYGSHRPYDFCRTADRHCSERAFCRKSSDGGNCGWYHMTTGTLLHCENVEPLFQPDVTLPPWLTILLEREQPTNEDQERLGEDLPASEETDPEVDSEIESPHDAEEDVATVDPSSINPES